MAELFDHGIDADACLVALDGSDDIEAIVVADLLVKRWDCVVVGGGIRHSEELLELFETVINLIRRHAPSAEIVFNRAPERLLEAVLRRSPSD